MRRFRADLHIHSCLSPCSDLDMTPKAIAEKSLAEGLDLIALCDHNTAENVGAAIRVGTKMGIHVLPGLEISSKEEVHIVALFDHEAEALAMQKVVSQNLKGTNRPEIFGEQVIVNEFDEVEGFNDLRLIGATELTVYEIVTEVHLLGGLSIASHIDRPSYSLISQLGFIPPDLELDGLEISRHGDRESLSSQIPEALQPALISSSDAHFLDDIGSVHTTFQLEQPNLGEIRMALGRNRGRKVIH